MAAREADDVRGGGVDEIADRIVRGLEHAVDVDQLEKDHQANGVDGIVGGAHVGYVVVHLARFFGDGLLHPQRNHQCVMGRANRHCAMRNASVVVLRMVAVSVILKQSHGEAGSDPCPARTGRSADRICAVTEVSQLLPMSGWIVP